MQVKKVTGRAGWYLDLVVFHLSNGKQYKIGKYGGSARPAFNLNEGEYIVKVGCERRAEYCGIGVELHTNRGRIHTFKGVKSKKRVDKWITAGPGKQFIGLKLSGSHIVGGIFADIPEQQKGSAKLDEKGAVKCARGHAMKVSSYAAGGYSHGWSCDQCRRLGRGERWFCQSCQSDLCFACRPKQGAQGSPKCPSSGHAMTISNEFVGGYVGGFICNGCRKRYYPGQARWNCKKCCDDYCYNCRPRVPPPGSSDAKKAPAAPSKSFKCNRGHPMKISAYAQGPYGAGWVCNHCKSSKRGERWLCLQCHDDYCFSCEPRSDAIRAVSRKGLSGPFTGKFLPGYAAVNPCKYATLRMAHSAADKNAGQVGGITYEPNSKMYTLRKGRSLRGSPSGEISWMVPEEKFSGGFQKAMSELESLILARAAAKSGREVKGGNDQKAPAPPMLRRQLSEENRVKWTENRDYKSILPEYRAAYDMICLKPDWIRYTKSIAVIESLSEVFENRPHILKLLTNDAFFDETVNKLIKKGYRLASISAAAGQKDILTKMNILQTLRTVYKWLKWRKPFWTLGFQYWLHLLDPDTIVSKLGLVVDRAHRCESAKRLAFDMVVRQAFDGLDQKKDDGKKKVLGEAMTLAEAKAKCKAIFEEYIDLHKDHAFRSAVIEPTICYYETLREWSGGIETHGLNWHLAAFMSCLGMQLPIIPYLSDPYFCQITTYWHASGGDKMWNEFKKLENFGKNYKTVKALAKLKEARGLKKCSSLFFNKTWKTPREFATDLNNPRSSKADAGVKKKWAVYLEHLCHFFTHEFFCKKAVSILMQEDSDRPVFLGFRDCMKQLYKHYRAAKNTPEERWLDYICDSETFEYDAGRINNLLYFAGITKKEVAVQPRKVQAAKVPDAKVAKPKLEFQGDQKLLNRVRELLKGGKGQMEIFKVCKDEKLGGNADIFKAVRFAQANLAAEAAGVQPSSNSLEKYELSLKFAILDKKITPAELKELKKSIPGFNEKDMFAALERLGVSKREWESFLRLGKKDFIPEEFLCPITYDLMTDPVVCKDGRSYEKEVVTEWIKKHGTSPLTRQKLTLQDMFPNLALKSLIDKFKAANPELL